MAEDSFVVPGQRVLLDRVSEGSGFAGIHRRIVWRAALTPEAPAVACGDRSLSYEELEVRSAALACRLRALGVGPETVVGVHLERSPDAVVALLGVLRAGGAYLPLDPAYPRERLAYMLEDSGAAALVTREELRAGLPGRVPLVLSIDGAGEGSGPRTPEIDEAEPESLAYVLYTSGSSGRPKGVGISHAALAHHAAAMARSFGLATRDRVLQFAALSFDVAAEEIYPTLLAGAAVVLPSDARMIEPERLAAFVERERLTVLNLPSPYWHEWVVSLAESGRALPPSLRLLVAGSEAVAADKLALWRRLPGAERVAWLNAYGLTESTITSTAFRLRAEDKEIAPVPVGRPVGEVRAYVLDERGQPVAMDTPGELWLGGPGVARGYLGRPDLTAERFVPDPFGEPGARLLRTGDLARLGPDGNLRLLGRADAQIKVRGFRLEPGEIEAALCGHPVVRQAVVLARGESLVACLVAAPGAEIPAASELCDLLRQSLPEHMVPAAFVKLDSLPLTANGKVDRRAIAAIAAIASAAQAAPGAEHGEEYAAPRTPVEETLTALWAELLGLDRVGVHDEFFHLGGHSLLATRLVSRVRAMLGVEIDLCDVFEAPTPAGLARRVEGAWRPEAPPLVPAPPAPFRPLSSAQRRLWFLHRFQGGSGVYNMPTLLRVRGPLCRPALAAALAEVTRRHEALRTVFTSVDGEPVQVVLPFTPPALPVIDLSVLPETERRAEADRLAAAEVQTPFELEEGPLSRTVLFALGTEEHALLVNAHHIVTDGWSVGVLVREVAALYEASAAGRPSPLPELPVQYGDFAVWQRTWLNGAVLEAQLDHWRQRLAGAPVVLDLPTDRPRPPVQTFRGAVEPLLLSRELARGLEQAGRAQGATLFMTLLAGFQTLLGRVSGQDDLLVGSPVANRNRAETEDLIGFFVNTLVLRTGLAGDPTFAELLGRVRAVSLAAYAHQDVPFERLVEALAPERDLSRTPLFQVVFGLHNAPMPQMELAPGLELTLEEPHTGTSKFDLSLMLEESRDGLAGTIEYSTDLFDAATVRRLARSFQVLLEAAAADPATRLSDLPLLTAEERRQVLGDWNDTAIDFPRDVPVHRLVEARAAAAPGAAAVASLTYGELNERANRLARYLRRLGAGPERVVAVLLERSAELATAALAVLKAGGAYLPLDPAYPADRVAFMIEDSGADVVLTRAGLASSLPNRGETAVLLDREVWGGESATDLDGLGVDILPESLAYVIYTSGSTGRPKGVAVQHASLANLVDWHCRTYGLTPDDRGCLLAGPAFDASVWELWPSLAAGASLLVPDESVRLAPPRLANWLRAARVTRCFLATPLAEAVIALGGEFPDLRTVLTGGDRLHQVSALPFPLVNHYGPTESTVVATCAPVAADGVGSEGDPTIGRPIANTRVYVLDRTGQPAALGMPGELCIGGSGLARGYLGRPDLTSGRLIPDPFSGEPGARLYRTGDLVRHLPSGELAFIGRIDHQVKIRSQRIELGEIESALARHPQVRQAVVLVQADRNGDQRLVAYVLVADEEPAASDLRCFLRESLPDSMVPAAFVPLTMFPLTANGKVDRRALPELGAMADPPRGEVEFVAPRTPLEEAVAEIWREVLAVERVGVRDRFWDLGGHSLLASKVLARIHDAFGVELPIQALFEHPVIEELTTAIGQALLAGADDAAHMLAELDGLTDEELETLLANPA
ncbi:MAG TPA: amino acid adenylation domain-containing protein [Thermoanaerobaculia bacterium]|nr:amino acid adenylation domain-containing protein [Thermoanaerobaculia bacterium]